MAWCPYEVGLKLSFHRQIELFVGVESQCEQGSLNGVFVFVGLWDCVFVCRVQHSVCVCTAVCVDSGQQ